MYDLALIVLSLAIVWMFRATAKMDGRKI